MADDDDEWEEYNPDAANDTPEPQSATQPVAGRSDNLDDGPAAKRQRTQEQTQSAWGDDGDFGEYGDDLLMQSIMELTGETGNDVTEASEPVGEVELPPPDASLGDLIKASLGENKKPRSKAKAKADPSTSNALVPHTAVNTMHITSNTYHRKKVSGSGAWTEEESRRLYTVLRQYGTDFSLLENFFPNRTRHEIKLKYRRDEKRNPGFMTDLLKDRKPIDTKLYAEWKDKSEQFRKDAQEKELDSMEMAINEEELLAELGDLAGPLGLEGMTETLPTAINDDAHTSVPAANDASAPTATGGTADDDEEGYGDDDLMEGYTDDLAMGYGMAMGGGLPDLPSYADDGVEYYD